MIKMKKYILTFLFLFCSFCGFATSFSSIHFNKGEVEPIYNTYGYNYGNEVLDELLFHLQSHPLVNFILIGHTDSYECKDSIGAINLSKKRAYFCRDFLVKNGIDSCRLDIRFYGRDQPTVPNDVDGIPNEVNQAINRRVEVIPIMRSYKVLTQEITNSVDSLIFFAEKFRSNFSSKNVVVCAYGGRTEDINSYLRYNFTALSYISIRELDEGGFSIPDLKTPKELHKYATHLLIDDIYDYNFENSDNFVVFVLEWTCEE